MTNDGANVASPLSGTRQGDRQVGQGRECQFTLYKENWNTV